MSDHGIVDIIDFDDSENYSFEQLKNDRELILQEIESQDDRGALIDLCEIEREFIEQEVKLLPDREQVVNYLHKVCMFYSEKVSLLMGEIFTQVKDKDSSNLDELIQIRNATISELKESIRTHEVAEKRLKELEIENTQLRKMRLRTEESELRLKDLQDKYRVLEGVVNRDSSVLESLDFEEIITWERRLEEASITLREQKDEIYRESLCAETPKPKCIICSKRVAVIMLRPCNHICFCQQCSNSVSKCPFDRKHITKRERVFLP